MGISVAYHLCVAPDHDTFESSIVNSIEAKREGGHSSGHANTCFDGNAAKDGVKMAGRRGTGQTVQDSCRSSSSVTDSNTSSDSDSNSNNDSNSNSNSDSNNNSNSDSDRQEERAGEESERGGRSCSGEATRREQNDGDDWGEVQVRALEP